MLVQSILRRWGIAIAGIACIAVLATAIARQSGAGTAAAALATLELDKEEYNIGDAPNVTVRVEPITALPSVDVAANLFFSPDPDPIVTSALPAVLLGIIPNGDGTVTLQLDAVTCLSPQLFLQGTITDPVTGQIFEVTNDRYLRINYAQGIDPADIPDCVFQDIDIDGDGEPDIPANVPDGGEGCSASFWKSCASDQLNQSLDDDDDDDGDGGCTFPLPLFPDTLFAEVFEDAFPQKNLYNVLKRQTSGSDALRNLGKETVAALLNATSAEVSYDLTVEEVIQLFNDAFPGTDSQYKDLRDFFQMLNNQGASLCPQFLIDFRPGGGGSVGGRRR